MGQCFSACASEDESVIKARKEYDWYNIVLQDPDYLGHWAGGGPWIDDCFGRRWHTRVLRTMDPAMKQVLFGHTDPRPGGDWQGGHRNH